MIRNNKRGLSDIVTNVLIILLVLVAVGILWAFLQPTIQQGAGGLEGATDCLTVDVEAVSCSVNTQFNGVVLSVKRNVGNGDLQNIKAVFTVGGQNVVKELDDLATWGNGLEEFESVDFGFVYNNPSLPTNLGTTAPTEVRVAPVVGSAANAKTCRESVTIPCN